jgi:hypothetical protein
VHCLVTVANMDGPGFHVDVPKVTEAAKGVAESVGDQERFALKKLPGGVEQYGNDDLCDALTDFCSRWSDGLDILTEDAEAISDSLYRVAQAYKASDQGAATRLISDPAVDVVDG